jgi:5-methylcytosine-specific restriction endonuclease McrA
VANPCKKCGATERYKDGRCKPCVAKYNRAYYKANRDKKAERKRAYRAANRDKVAKYNRAYREANRDKEAKYHRAWREANPEKERRVKARRRARKAGAKGSHTAKQWEKLVKHYGGRCLCCGRNDVPMTADHIVPLCQGGSDSITNIQPLCLSCNSSKGVRSIDYRPDRGPERWVQTLLFSLRRST